MSFSWFLRCHCCSSMLHYFFFCTANTITLAITLTIAISLTISFAIGLTLTIPSAFIVAFIVHTLLLFSCTDRKSGCSHPWKYSSHNIYKLFKVQLNTTNSRMYQWVNLSVNIFRNICCITSANFVQTNSKALKSFVLASRISSTLVFIWDDFKANYSPLIF